MLPLSLLPLSLLPLSLLPPPLLPPPLLPLPLVSHQVWDQLLEESWPAEDSREEDRHNIGWGRGRRAVST
jgi:hypothetical protein